MDYQALANASGISVYTVRERFTSGSLSYFSLPQLKSMLNWCKHNMREAIGLRGISGMKKSDVAERLAVFAALSAPSSQASSDATSHTSSQDYGLMGSSASSSAGAAAASSSSSNAPELICVSSDDEDEEATLFAPPPPPPPPRPLPSLSSVPPTRPPPPPISSSSSSSPQHQHQQPPRPFPIFANNPPPQNRQVPDHIAQLRFIGYNAGGGRGGPGSHSSIGCMMMEGGGGGGGGLPGPIMLGSNPFAAAPPRPPSSHGRGAACTFGFGAGMAGGGFSNGSNSSAFGGGIKRPIPSSRTGQNGGGSSSSGNGAGDVDWNDPNKRPKRPEEADGKGGTARVEVKKEKQQRKINATPAELQKARAFQQTTGLPIEEGLTALRVNNFDQEKALMWYIEATQQDGLEMMLVHAASIESEKANDQYRRGEAMREEQLKHEGDVLASGDFRESTLLHESTSVVTFFRSLCRQANAGGSSSSPSSSRDSHHAVNNYSSNNNGTYGDASIPGQGPADRQEEGGGQSQNTERRRRELVVKMLIWEKKAVKWYKQDATAYIKALASRLDEAANRSPTSSLPLDLLEEEATTFENALTYYPGGNVGGVPEVFLKYSCKNLHLDSDGLELVDEEDALPTYDGERGGEEGEGGGGGGGGGGIMRAESKGGGGRLSRSSGGGGSGRRKSAVAECIEVLD